LNRDRIGRDDPAGSRGLPRPATTRRPPHGSASTVLASTQGSDRPVPGSVAGTPEHEIHLRSSQGIRLEAPGNQTQGEHPPPIGVIDRRSQHARVPEKTRARDPVSGLTMY
jgi:hypothetical protein